MAPTGAATSAAGASGEETDDHFRALIDERGWPTRTHGALRAGDATFHSGWTVHSAGRNPSDTLRTVMTVIYYADGARVPLDVSDAQETDRRAWLGGRPRARSPTTS